MDSSEGNRELIPACKRYIDELQIEEEEKQPGNLQDIEQSSLSESISASNRRSSSEYDYDVLDKHKLMVEKSK